METFSSLMLLISSLIKLTPKSLNYTAMGVNFQVMYHSFEYRGMCVLDLKPVITNPLASRFLTKTNILLYQNFSVWIH